jgi:hypothetical protein
MGCTPAIIILSLRSLCIFLLYIVSNTCLAELSLLGDSSLSSLSTRLVLLQEGLGDEDVVSSGDGAIMIDTG